MTSGMKYAKVNHYTMYTIATFDGKAKCLIDCHPQQIWQCEIIDKTVALARKGMTLMIPKEDFEKYWKVVEK